MRFSKQSRTKGPLRMAVLVTGGAGYVGSHIVLAFQDQGVPVAVIDNLSTGLAGSVSNDVPFHEGDIADQALIAEIIATHQIRTIVHCAGSTVVPDSVADPLSYYKNNTLNATLMLEAAVGAGVTHVLFSSTAAVYGVPQTPTVAEDHPVAPASPYGASKLMFERVLADTAQATGPTYTGLTYAALRYFNVAGADPQGRAGQSTPDATHLIKVCAEVVAGRRDALTIYGDDYATKDGTCVRDFIHVSDLAQAHLDVLDHIQKTGTSVTFNCGYSQGFSVKDVIAEIEAQTGRAFPAIAGPRRAGDVPEVVANADHLRQTVGWTPRYDSLSVMIADALRWEMGRAS